MKQRQPRKLTRKSSKPAGYIKVCEDVYKEIMGDTLGFQEYMAFVSAELITLINQHATFYGLPPEEVLDLIDKPTALMMYNAAWALKAYRNQIDLKMNKLYNKKLEEKRIANQGHNLVS